MLFALYLQLRDGISVRQPFCKKMKRILFLLFAAALLASCCPCRKAHRLMAKRPVTGIEWQLIRWDNNDIDPDKGSYTLRFTADGKLAGRAVCNTYTASWRKDASMKMQIDKLGATLRSCPTDEQPYFRMLEQTDHYRFDGDMLLLLAGGRLQAVFQPSGAQ